MNLHEKDQMKSRIQKDNNSVHSDQQISGLSSKSNIDDKDSVSGSSKNQDLEHQLEFYKNVHAMKTVQNVSIESYDNVSTGSERYTSYSIRVQTDMLNYNINKRYREFRQLYNRMKEVYSDIELKNFPRKKILSSLQKKTIETRMIQLNCFIKEVFDAYNDRQIWFFLDFINLEGEFKVKGINDFFRQQANSTVLLQEIHPEMVNIVPIVATNDNETKMIEFLQKLNAFSETIILSFDKLRNFYFQDQPVLCQSFIPLILFGQGKMKGILEIALTVSKDASSEGHLVCSHGLKLILDLMDIQKNPSAQQFIDVFTSATFQDMKKYNFRAHILNKCKKECKNLTIRLLKIYIDAHSETLKKVTRQLFLDDKSFEEYVKVVKLKNVPKKLLSEGLYNLLNDEQQSNDTLNGGAENNSSTGQSSRDSSGHQQNYDFKEQFMFKRESVIDKQSNTFADSHIYSSEFSDQCKFEDLKEAIDDENIEWRQLYTVEDSLYIKYCDVPDKYVLITAFLPLSIADSYAALYENRSKWDTLLSEYGKIGINERGEEVWKESLFVYSYSGTKLITFLHKRSIMEEQDALYVFKEPTDFTDYKNQSNEDSGKMYQCIKFSAFNSGMMKSKRNLSSEEEDEEFKHTLEGKSVFTKVDLMLRPSNNKSFVFISPFLLNDDQQFVDNFLNLINTCSTYVKQQPSSHKNSLSP